MSMPVLALVALGSNTGDSTATLAAAIELLRQRAAARFRVSSLWRSTPVDCPAGSADFLNTAVCFEPGPGETPESLLDTLQHWERAFGREPRLILNEPRPLDLDLIAFGAETRSSPTLTLPHPRAHLRRFVLEPLAEIAPEFLPPGWPAPIGRVRDLLPSGLRTQSLERLPAPRPGILASPFEDLMQD